MTNARLQLSEHAGKIARIHQSRDDVQLAACNITRIDAFHIEIFYVRAECVTEEVDHAGDDLQNYPLNLELRP